MTEAQHIRRRDWHEILSSRLAEFRAAEYAPEKKRDCFVMVFGYVDLVLGTEIATPWIGKYNTIAGALRLLKKHGYDDLTGFAKAHLPQVAPAQARPGDIAVIVDNEGREHFAFCLGMWFETITEAGPLRCGFERVASVFRVG